MPRGIPNRRLEAGDGDVFGGEDDILDQDVILDTPEPLLPAPEPVIIAPAVDISGKPEHLLTAEERRIRDLENQLALERGKKDVAPEYEAIETDAAGNIVIHIVDNGFTALGQNWYVGQELEFAPGSRAYKDTFDRRGNTWLSLAGNDMAQVEKYGKVMFRVGPWPGKGYADSAALPLQHPLRAMSGPGTVMPPTQDELHAAHRAETARGRRAPHLPMR